MRKIIGYEGRCQECGTFMFHYTDCCYESQEWTDSGRMDEFAACSNCAQPLMLQAVYGEDDECCDHALLA